MKEINIFEEGPNYIKEQKKEFVLTNEGHRYEIPKKALKTYSDFADWTRQLTGKNWVTMDMVWQFTRVAINHIEGKDYSRYINDTEKRSKKHARH